MTTTNGWIAVLASMTMSAVTNAAMMLENNSSLTPATPATKIITPEIVRKIEEQFKNFCEPSENPSYTKNATLGGLSPGVAVVSTLKQYEIAAIEEVKAIIIQQPAHGKISMIGLATKAFPGLSLEEFQYTPEKNFLGDDKVAFEVTANGQKFRISFVIRVVNGGLDDACEPKKD